jgi:hypothetical protein
MHIVVCLPIRCLETGSFIVVCVFVAAEMCLPSGCLAMDVCCGSTNPAFRRHVTILNWILMKRYENKDTAGLGK